MLSLVVDVIIAITKFTHGAWVIIILVPIMVIALRPAQPAVRERGRRARARRTRAAEAPILRRHVVLVLVDALDMAAARAIQYARTLTPDELRAVHFDLDPIRDRRPRRRVARARAWPRCRLDVIDCPDRRLTRAAAEVVARS